MGEAKAQALKRKKAWILTAVIAAALVLGFLVWTNWSKVGHGWRDAGEYLKERQGLIRKK